MENSHLMLMGPFSQFPRLDSLEDKIPDCPATIWSAKNMDIAAEQAKYKVFLFRVPPLSDYGQSQTEGREL